MKKGVAAFLTILAVLLLVGGIELLFFGIVYREPVPKIGTVSDIGTNFRYLYLEDIEVEEKFAFKTEEKIQYRDMVTETYEYEYEYHVYDASESNYKGDVIQEYYVVTFRDAAGTMYTADMTVSPKDGLFSSYDTFPRRISACVLVSTGAPDRSDLNDKDTYTRLKAAALFGYSDRTGIPCSDYSMEYKGATVAQFEEDWIQDANEAGTIEIVFGAILLAGGAALLIIVKIKKKKAGVVAAADPS